MAFSDKSNEESGERTFGKAGTSDSPQFLQNVINPNNGYETPRLTFKNEIETNQRSAVVWGILGNFLQGCAIGTIAYTLTNDLLTSIPAGIYFASGGMCKDASRRDSNYVLHLSHIETIENDCRK